MGLYICLEGERRRGVWTNHITSLTGVTTGETLVVTMVTAGTVQMASF